jgi:hypothetical protein
MGRVGRIAALLALTCAPLACKKESADTRAAEPAALRSAAAPAQAEESPYDAQGRLKPSAERVEWLQIPMGFVRKPSSDERHVRFEAGPLPLDKVRDFVSARCLTGAVEESTYSSAYRAVQPLENDPKALRLNITLLARPGLQSTVLEIERLTYGNAKPLVVDEARRVLARERAEAE